MGHAAYIAQFSQQLGGAEGERWQAYLERWVSGCANPSFCYIYAVERDLDAGPREQVSLPGVGAGGSVDAD